MENRNTEPDLQRDLPAIRDEIMVFDHLRQNLTEKLKLVNWIVVTSHKHLYLFNLNRKRNGNLSVRNTIGIDTDLMATVFDEMNDDSCSTVKLNRWSQLQTLIEQLSVMVKRECDFDFECVMETQPESVAAFEFCATNANHGPHHTPNGVTVPVNDSLVKDESPISSDSEQKYSEAKRQQPFECTSCNKTFPTQTQFTNHMRRHDKSKWKQCPICKKTYFSSLSRHINDMHLKLKNHVCDICGSAFSQLVLLKEHITSKHLRSYECNRCNKKFPSRYTLKSHTNLMHSDDGTQYKCKICDKQFGFKSSLDTHEKLHTGNTHICHECGQSFKHPNYLRKHLNRHKGVKKKECKMCEKRYANNIDLRLHCKKVHDIIVEPTRHTVEFH